MRRNTSFLLAARLTSAVTTLVVLSIVSRTSGVNALGEVGLGLAIGSIAAAIADLGTASLLVREGSRDLTTARPLFRAGLLIRVLLSPPLLAATYVIAVLSGAEDPGVVVLVAAGLVAQQTAELTRSVFNAQQRMAISGGHAVVENLVWIGVVWVALAFGADLSTTFALALSVWLASVVAGMLLIRFVGRLPTRSAPGRSLGDTVRVALPFGAFSLTGIAYSRIDTVLLGLLLPTNGLAAAGAYYAAARLIAAFEYLPDALTRAVFPELSRSAVEDPAEVRAILRATASNLLAIACLGPVILATGAASLMVILFGQELAAGAPILAFMSFVLPFRFLGYLFGMTLTSADAQGRRVAAASLALVVVLVIDLVGIPAIGVGAAVVGALAASIVTFSIYAWSVARRFGSAGLRPAVTIAIVGAMIGAILVGLALGQVVTQLVAAGVAAGVYVLVLAIGPLLPVVRRSARLSRVP